MLRALLRPSAIVSHLLVAVVVVTCVGFGQWQLDRLHEVRDTNARLEERLAAPPADLAALADPAGTMRGSVDEAGLEYRRVEVTGTFRPEEEVLQRNRSYRNQTGFHVLTPLELTDGGVVLVRRGWVPASLDTPPVTQAPPPEGQVSVVGVLERPVEQPGFGPQDPDDGLLERVFHTDTGRLDRQIDGALFPMVLRIDAELDNPTQEQLPFPVGSPALDEGSHLSYTVQWHSFALLALITYLAWWWHRLRRRPPSAPEGDDPPADDHPQASTGGHTPDRVGSRR